MSKKQVHAMEVPASLQFYSIAEVAIIMDVSKPMVLEWIKEGELLSFRVKKSSRTIRVRRQDLEDFIDKNTQLNPQQE
ncbi:MAG: helix-turn-helix domain-containing protein [Chloroflexota bacterium]|nr:helix-turn-helix domain-containing protein [Chloroflexota bacterium]